MEIQYQYIIIILGSGHVDAPSVCCTISIPSYSTGPGIDFNFTDQCSYYHKTMCDMDHFVWSLHTLIEYHPNLPRVPQFTPDNQESSMQPVVPRGHLHKTNQKVTHLFVLTSRYFAHCPFAKFHIRWLALHWNDFSSFQALNKYVQCDFRDITGAILVLKKWGSIISNDQ